MAFECTARLVLRPSNEGGLKSPLSTPTPSLVFRPVEADDTGLVGVIQLSSGRLEAGTEFDARVVFPQDEAEPFIGVGRRFLLWNGRVVGTAEIVSAGG